METGLEAVLHNGGVYLDNVFLMDALIIEGRDIAYGIKSGGPRRDHRTLSDEEQREEIRAYLRKHGDVIGAEFLSAYRLKLYNAVADLSIAELSERLLNVVNAGSDVYYRSPGRAVLAEMLRKLQ
jgi:hypothetical protein